MLWHTGARVGEALSIKLSDLDLKNNRIFVANKIYKGEQEALLLTPEALRIAEQAQELAILRKDKKLFQWRKTALPNDLVKKAERKFGAKIEGRGLHGFRRAFANKLFEQHLEITEIQEIMRHRNITTTLDHYKEFRQKELIEKMSKKL